MVIPSISLIFVTNRMGWQDILQDNLERQTFRDFEVIVADENYDKHLLPFGVTHFKPREKSEDDAWNLNKAYNDCLDRAHGELLVFLQDFIWIPNDGLERFWKAHENNPKAFVTGVGHKAQDHLEGISEPDRRMEKYNQGIHECPFDEWEMNWAAAPRKIMPRFAESMDKYYGGENQYVAKKAFLQGAKILIDRDNVCKAYSQEFCGGRISDWEDRHSWREGRLAAFLKYLDITGGKGVD